MFTEYGITTPVTNNLCDILRSKLWRMGQRINKPGAKKSQILNARRCGKESVWKLSINCSKANSELTSQIIVNEKKINKLKEINKLLETDLSETQQKLKQVQQEQSTLLKTNKRMASALVAGPNPKRKKRFIPTLPSAEMEQKKTNSQ